MLNWQAADRRAADAYRDAIEAAWQQTSDGDAEDAADGAARAAAAAQQAASALSSASEEQVKSFGSPPTPPVMPRMVRMVVEAAEVEEGEAERVGAIAREARERAAKSVEERGVKQKLLEARERALERLRRGEDDEEVEATESNLASLEAAMMMTEAEAAREESRKADGDESESRDAFKRAYEERLASQARQAAAAAFAAPDAAARSAASPEVAAAAAAERTARLDDIIVNGGEYDLKRRIEAAVKAEDYRGAARLQKQLQDLRVYIGEKEAAAKAARFPPLPPQVVPPTATTPAEAGAEAGAASVDASSASVDPIAARLAELEAKLNALKRPSPPPDGDDAPPAK